ncbi:MAG: helix-turn-helix domain-containing protein [Eubacteriales bacterium]|nr:helix-turn-helix domain-containing protein [Eubacteriales bacterium]
MKNNVFATAQEVAQELGVSRATAYKMIHEWNEKLKARGYTAVSGRVSRRFFQEQFYGMEQGGEQCASL